MAAPSVMWRASRCAALAAVLGLAVAAPALPGRAAAEPAVAQLALDLANADRAAAGLPPLQAAGSLTRAAQAHADDMLQRDFFGHRAPDGGTVQDRYLDAGGEPFLLVAENLARCDRCAGPAAAARLARLQAGWMASAGHRRNLLAEGFDRFGFGLARDGERLYAVQTFAGPGPPLSGAGEAPPRAVPPAIAADLVRDRVNGQRTAAGLRPLAGDAALDLTARAMLPAAGVALSLPQGAARAALPDASAGDWAEVLVLGAVCSGCGIAVTDADLAVFVADWLSDDGARAALLRDGLTHLGIAAGTPDRGRKALILVAGRLR